MPDGCVLVEGAEQRLKILDRILRLIVGDEVGSAGDLLRLLDECGDCFGAGLDGVFDVEKIDEAAIPVGGVEDDGAAAAAPHGVPVSVQSDDASEPERAGAESAVFGVGRERQAFGDG